MTSPARLPILMYHSISRGAGPTCIPPETFRSQIQMIKDHGWSVVTLHDVAAWHAGGKDLPEKTLAITFDDGFTDYADNAHSVLEDLGFPSTMFVPTALTGQSENWYGGGESGRAIMGWSTLRDLDTTQAEIAPHGRRHKELTSLSKSDLDSEVLGSKQDLEEALSRETKLFAPPYGKSNHSVRSLITETFELSVGVEFANARSRNPIHDLPRIEMFYYTDLERWSDFLTGSGKTYLTIRQSLRKIKGVVTAILP